jgi:dTDP-4-dehydrorhamnose reductase
MTRLPIWGGVECTVNRVHNRYFDQVVRSGHIARLDDVDRFAACGFSALRTPVLWEHVAPGSPEDRGWCWADAYLHRIRGSGMTPVVGLLHHGSGPAYTSLLDPRFPELFAAYARAAAERYPWVTMWTPINEPLTTARFSALYGHWFPHETSDRSFVRALMNQIRGIALAMREIRAVNRDARLVQTEDAGAVSGTPEVKAQVEFEESRRWLTWDLLMGRVDADHPMWSYLRGAGAGAIELAALCERSCVPDVIGLNYYLTSDRWLDERLALYPESVHGGNGRQAYADVERVRARSEGIVGHEHHLVTAWKRYGRPVAITEAHLGCSREEQLRWLNEAWRGAQTALRRGVNVEAITAWALLGSFDWDSLVTNDVGHYEPGVFDVRSAPPRGTALASIVTQMARGEEPAHPVLAVDGWWRRPERLVFGSAGPAKLCPDCPSAPLLIVGGRGALSHAIQQMCRDRGLAAHIAGRHELDIEDHAATDAMLRRLQPWAVINTADYAHVDAADSEVAACWRDNVAGPVNLAAACRRRGVRLVMFSSDLVFDGTSPRPYVESDPVSPPTAYGATKAEAERRVVTLLPEALVVRTSAFFGLWDDEDFPARVLRRISTGRVFTVHDEATVSPTFLPDLVHAVLDLLIDGEAGIWHLTNAGAVTWCEFGQAVARTLGYTERLVTPGSNGSHTSTRPRYRALGSERAQLLPTLQSAIDRFTSQIRLNGGVIVKCALS